MTALAGLRSEKRLSHDPEHPHRRPCVVRSGFVTLMNQDLHIIAVLALLTWPGAAQDLPSKAIKSVDAGNVTAHAQGLHGYIGFGHEKLPREGGYTAGMGFYAAVWPLADQPLADFQIGLPGSWIQPDNSDTRTNRWLRRARSRARGRSVVRRGAASSKPWKAAWVTGRATISATVRRSSA